jgi:exosome complex component RRP41
MDYLAITGLRTDGRLPSEHRRVNVELGVHSSGDGSAMFELGHTKVWATCRGPRESTTTFGVTVEVSTAAFSTMERRKQNRGDRKARELSQALEKALARIVDTKTFPRSRVDLQLRLIQLDGGLPWACFNACSLALMDAGVPMRDLCVACGVGFIDRVVLVDPNASESMSFGGANSGGELWMAIAPREMKIVSCAFNGKVSQATLDLMMAAAEDGCKQMFNVLGVYVTSFYKNLNLDEDKLLMEGDIEDEDDFTKA